MIKKIPNFLRRLTERCTNLAALFRAAAFLLSFGLAPAAWAALVVDAGNHTVTDTVTGLMWDQCTYGKTTTSTPCDTGRVVSYIWVEGLKKSVEANTAGYKGFSDWRLPNRNELESISKIDFDPNGGPTVDTTVFPSIQPVIYWTSTTYAIDPAQAWVMFFNNGLSVQRNKTSDFGAVLLVRGGQSKASFDAGRSSATPAAPVATAGNFTATVTFVAPDDYENPITGYTVVSTPPGGSDSDSDTTRLTHNIRNLSNGVAYTFAVYSTNSTGRVSQHSLAVASRTIA